MRNPWDRSPFCFIFVIQANDGVLTWFALLAAPVLPIFSPRITFPLFTGAPGKNAIEQVLLAADGLHFSAHC